MVEKIFLPENPLLRTTRGINDNLSAYLEECLTVGYPLGPLEQEAKKMETEILG